MRLACAFERLVGSVSGGLSKRSWRQGAHTRRGLNRVEMRSCSYLVMGRDSIAGFGFETVCVHGSYAGSGWVRCCMINSYVRIVKAELGTVRTRLTVMPL